MFARIFLGAALAAAALAPASAQSVFVQVATGANVGNGTANGGGVGYQYSTGSGGGPAFSQTYPDTQNSYTGSVAPGLFIAHASTTTTQSYFGSRTVTAFGKANLANGTLHLNVVNNPNTFSSVVASFNDLVTLNIPGAGPNTETLIGVRAYAHGSLAGVNGQFFDHLDVGGQVLQTGDLQFVADTHPFDANTLQSATGWVSPSFSHVSFGNFDFTGYIVVLGANPVLNVTDYATLGLNEDGVGDYGHTSALHFVLPQGVTLSSASGVFGSTVPEPSTWALLLCGIGGLGGMLRDRRRMPEAVWPGP